MRSPKQIEASRINGRRSQGPITPQGKYNSSRNNLRHGLLAQTVVLEKESEERFLELLDEYMQAHQPQSVTEAGLVETMVIAKWRQLRIVGLQKLALDHDIAVQDPEIGPSSVRAMYALRGTPDTPARPDVLLRYEVTYDRMFKSALRHLESLVRHRKPSTGPYFPAHPSGHNWKDEGCGADLQEEQEPASAALRFGRFNNKKDEPPNRDGNEADQAGQAPDSPAAGAPNSDCQGAGLRKSSDSPKASSPALPPATPPANPKTPHAIRPRQPVESKTPPKSDPKNPKIHSPRGKRAPSRPKPIQPSASKNGSPPASSGPSASGAEGRPAQAKLRIRRTGAK